VSTTSIDIRSLEDIRHIMELHRGEAVHSSPEGAALSGLERLLIQLVDCQPDATFAIDREHRVIAWNRAMEELTGMKTSEILGKAGCEYALPFRGVREPILIDYVLSRDEAVLARYPGVSLDGEALVAEIEIPSGQNRPTVLWIKAQSVHDFGGDIIGAIESFRDITPYKRVQEELREVDARYRALFDSSLYCVYVHDLDGRFIDANNATLRELGYTIEELKGRHFSSLVSREQYPLAARIRNEILKNGSQQGLAEFTVKRKDGTTFTIESNGALIHQDGRPYAIQGVARNITERKLAEEALRESENRYRSVFENVSDFLIIHELDGTIVETNVASIRHSGYARDDLKGMNIRDLIPEKYRQGFDQYMSRIVENGQDEGMLRVMTRDGDDRIVEYRNVLIRHQDSRPRYIQGSARDITEQVRVRKALKESTEKYRNIVENMQEGYFEVDLSGRFTFFNHMICVALGYTE
jgi:PAS domain S-box-containing protein